MTTKEALCWIAGKTIGSSRIAEAMQGSQGGNIMALEQVIAEISSHIKGVAAKNGMAVVSFTTSTIVIQKGRLALFVQFAEVPNMMPIITKGGDTSRDPF
jgi:hypothetical protein